MLAKLARIILAFSTFPLLGAYGLRWVGAFVAQWVSATGVAIHPLLALDLLGALAGLLLGIILAIQVVGCCLQAETSPARPVGDTILIILGLTLVLNVALVKVCHGAPWLHWAPLASLVVWTGCAAATGSVHRARLRWRRDREQQAVYLPPQVPPTAPYGG